MSVAAETGTIVDALVHPLVRTSSEIREYLREPFRSKAFPDVERYWYPNPVGEFAKGTKPESGFPGSDRRLLTRQIFDEGGAGVAILVPLTRGLLPEAELGTAVCAATNDWLAEVWLGDGRFRGSIRVNPTDPEGAAREIARWAKDPRMVQIAMPLQVQQPYGQRFYLPIWEAAARAGLPVCVQADVSAGIEFWPTAIGFPRHYIEFAMMHPFNPYFHLVSFICEGVFDRFADLRVIFADPGFSILYSLLWRLDKGWRSLQSDTPWAKRTPSEYVRRHVRFISNSNDGPDDPAMFASWLKANDAEHLLLFGSDYPYWDFAPAERTFERLGDDGLRARVLGGNARVFYRL